MKTAVKTGIIAIFALLAGCGGGGGPAPIIIPPIDTNPISDLKFCGANEVLRDLRCVCVSGYDRRDGVCVSSDTPFITPEEQTEARTEAANLRQAGQAATGLSESEKQEFLRQVAELETAINSERRTIKSLRAEIENLRNRLNALMNPPDASTATTITIAATNPSDGLNYRDAEFTVQYGLAQINADAAYQRGYFGQGVTVAVVDTGMLTSHADLRDNVVAGYDVLADTPAINDGISDYWNFLGHGSFVGGVIAASRGNGGMHGVAPQAKLMPLQFGHGQTGELNGEPLDAFEFALNRNVKIINNSWGAAAPLYGRYGSSGRNYQVWLPYLPQFWSGEDRDYMKQIADEVGNSDTVMVWAAGNDGWRDTDDKTILLCDDLRGGLTFQCEAPEQLLVSPRELWQNFESVAFTVSSVAIRYRILGDRNNYITFRSYGGDAYGLLSDSTLSSPGYYGLIPQEHPEMESKWLVVVATDANNEIASFSNGCGAAANWCLAAPGVTIYSVSGAPRTFLGTPITHRTQNGTSFAAPHVSGALALLKSRLPSMPMSVVRAILLTTATDLCATGGNCRDGIDEVYGWGLVNVEDAIAFSGGIQTQSGVLLSDLRGSLPAEFSHLRGRLSGVLVAVRITDGAYHNVALADIVGGVSDSRNANLGKAAKEMQTNEYAAGESFRFWGGIDSGGKSGFINDGNSPFAASDTSDTGGYVRWTTRDYGGISAFGEYGYTDIKAEYDSDSLIAGISDARAENWTAGIQYGDLFRHGDKLRISARQESRISGGDILIRHSVADGDFYKAFLGEKAQTIRAQTTRIPIKEKPATIWTFGYSQQTESGDWIAAAEWNAQTDAAGFSAEWRAEF